MQIGKKIRQFRLAKEWTLADLSKESKVALSSLSRMETGRMTGTLESHLRIAKALGVRLPELYADVDPTSEGVEIRSAAAPADRFVPAKSSASVTLLTRTCLEKKLLPALMRLKPRQTLRQERGAVGSERFLYALKGQVELSVGEERWELKTGDSAYLRADRAHAVKNTGAGPAEILSVITPPAL